MKLLIAVSVCVLVLYFTGSAYAQGNKDNSKKELVVLCNSTSCGSKGSCKDVEEANRIVKCCICQKPYTGVSCEVVDLCIDVDCNGNNGQCQNNANGTFSCNCRDGYSGNRCQTKLTSNSNCKANSCKNGGICSDDPEGTFYPFKCKCPKGFTGSLCQKIDFCSSEPCPSGQICNNLDKGRVCIGQEQGRP